MTTSALDGRIVLVTGASSGIGRRFALVLARHGAKVALAARRADMLRGAVEQIVSEGGDAVAIAMDVTEQTSVTAGFAAAAEALGPLDTVIANAGVTMPGSAVDQPVEDFDLVMRVNSRGVFLCAREGARHMLANGVASAGRGRVVIVASIGATQVIPGQSAYSASKASAVTLGRSLAREWVRKGINVNVLCPGYIETDLNREWFSSEPGQRQVANFHRRRVMREADLDGAILLLASDAAQALTGSVLTVDDGQTL